MQQIDSLTAETLISGIDEILKEVFDITDEYEREKILMKLTDKAEELKVKSKFTKLCSAYKKSLIEQQKQARLAAAAQNGTPMTELDGPYQPMFCGSWIVNDNGVNGFNALGMPITACYHPIIPISIMRNINTNNVKIKLAYKQDGQWQEITVDKIITANAAQAGKVLSGIGIGIDSEIAKYFVRYMSEMEHWNDGIIKRQASTSRLGWIDGEFMPYSVKYEFDGEQKFKATSESIREYGSEDIWMKMVRNVRKLDRIEPKISIAASLASILIEPLNALPFILNLWTETGKGKSVTMMIAASCWGNPIGFDYITDPQSTATAWELRIDLLNSLPFFLDDLSKVKKRYDGDFSELVYMLCSGKGKDRANIGLGLNKTNTWRNIIQTNYEYSLVTETMQGGAINRIIDVECSDENMFPDGEGNRIVGILRDNYGFAGRRFLEAVNQLGMPRIKEIQQEFHDRITGRAKELGIEKEEKQTLPMSIILTADKIATDYIFQDGIYLNFNQCVDLLKNKGEVSDNERAYQYIISDVNINLNKFTPDDPATGKYRGEIWGRIESGGWLVIQKNAFENIAKRGGFSSKSFLSWANKREMLDASTTRPPYKQKRFGGMSPWCVCLKVDFKEADRDTPTVSNKAPELPQDNEGFVQIPQELQGKLPWD